MPNIANTLSVRRSILLPRCEFANTCTVEQGIGTKDRVPFLTCPLAVVIVRMRCVRAPISVPPTPLHPHSLNLPVPPNPPAPLPPKPSPYAANTSTHTF